MAGKKAPVPPNLRERYWISFAGFLALNAAFPLALIVCQSFALTTFHKTFDDWLTLVVGVIVSVVLISPVLYPLHDGMFDCIYTDCERGDLRANLLRGLFPSVIYSLFNPMSWLAAYGVTENEFVSHDFGTIAVRFVMYFVVSGVIYNVWILWNVWPVRRPQEPFQFSLRTLLLGMLAIGVVLAIYVPRR